MQVLFCPRIDTTQASSRARPKPLADVHLGPVLLRSGLHTQVPCLLELLIQHLLAGLWPRA